MAKISPASLDGDAGLLIFSLKSIVKINGEVIRQFMITPQQIWTDIK
jgi:hypothetical protein